MTMATPDKALLVDLTAGTVKEVPASSIGCDTCGHLACVCSIIANHPDPECEFRISATCPTPIECDHGYDVCPTCDLCTCKPTEGEHM